MARGQLRIYLGAAPGVGKTYAMLGEARRRLDRGTDVVVGFVETHGRQLTAERLTGLETVRRRTVHYKGASFEEMDVDAILTRRPAVAIVDELAHTNVPGMRNEKRWQDVEELLDAGIEVLTTVNVQHLESLNDVVEQITGVPQRETVPDEVVRKADQIELVDMAPEALRKRMAHGNIYPAERVDAALSNYFRVGNLTALRELALLWVADRVDEVLNRYKAEHDIRRVWEARERVVVALTGGPEGETLIRRAARIAARSAGGEVLAVHVLRSDGLTGASPAKLRRQRELVESVGGSFHTVVGDDVPAALLDFARGVNATQLVLGTSRRSRLARAFAEGIGATVTAASGDIDVHMVTHAESGGWRRRLPRLTGGLNWRRRVAALVVAAVGLPLLTELLLAFGDEVTSASVLLLFLILVVGVALIGGLYPALIAAVAGGLIVNWFFVPPVGTFTIAERNNVVALLVYVLVAVAVATVVDRSARRATQAARGRAETAMLASLSRSVLAGNRGVPSLLEQIREAFALTSVTMLERDGERWAVAGFAGPNPCEKGGQADEDIPVTDDLRLLLCGRALAAADRRVLVSFAEQAAVALQRARLLRQAAEAEKLAEANRMRTALLAAVSHDLRTPLASIKAAIAGLRAEDIELDETDRKELLAAVDESADQLTSLVANLLDMSRLHTGTVAPTSQPVGYDEVVARALRGLEKAELARIEVDVPDTLPSVRADPGLLERVVANVVSNAVRHAPTGPVKVSASVHLDQIELRVIDRGPGIRPDDREKVFAPFQRLGDRDTGTGVGLGLAVARGFTEAMGGTLTPEDTPGGGVTMVIALPADSTTAPAVVP
ncbi:sensor histidine kinase [Fodinicola acaciae]|uniref:sensor histidine kinase n=1 Tax=Fodinicola acaciae TaxID=2681555 RepID=UPI0013D51EE2|nr:ATP-binding protein [Fodinicola acaciae]